MAKPNGTSWKDHQHVIMAINIKSDTNFEPTKDTTPVFYGSTNPFKVSKTGQQITITGTNVKNYGDLNKTAGTPILLVTRVRDITDKLDDFDKRYLVCSNALFDANTITATIAAGYDDWTSLQVLINNDMENKINIFERQNKYNSRLEQLIKNARTSIAALYAAPPPTVEPVKTAIVTPAKRKTDDNPPDYQNGFNSANDYFNSDAFIKWVKKYRDKHPEKDEPVSSFKGVVTAYFVDRSKNDKKQTVSNATRKINGGSPNDDLTSLDKIVSNNEDGFKKYVYFLLTQPFYFKLNALTPTMLTKIKSYILSGSNIRPNTSFDQHILQPFTNFAYVEYIVNIPNDTDLTEYDNLAKDHELIKNLSELIAHSISTDTVSNFASQIKKDTKNYKQLTNSAPRTYYIHIFRFIELIEKQIENTQTLYPSATSPLPEHVTVFIQYALNKIYEHMQQVTPIFDLLSSVDKILIQDKLKSQQQKQLKVYIDDYVSSQNRTDVITYLKINSTEPEGLNGNKPWNQRYDIRLKPSSLASEALQKFNAMILGYKMYNAPFYKQITYGKDKKKTIVAVDGLEGIVTYKTPKVDYNEIDTVNKYDKYYLFGNYENIFPLYNINSRQKETNLENAKNMTAIIEQICNDNKPVFLLGYGASGSGKTSSLIYFNKGKPEEKNGIVIHLCNVIIAKLNASVKTVDSVKVVVKEFYMTNDLNDHTSAEYVFDTDLNIISGNIGQSKHSYHVNMNNPVKEFKNMGQVLKQLVDVDRYVKATTNNPQSSRSHVLVFIQFCSNEPDKYPIRNLIIGDFAGKENEFQCADTDTVVAFLNTKIDNSESKYQGYPFYSAQIKGGDGKYENDPTDKIQGESGMIRTRKYISSAVATHTVYNFEKPFESGHFIKPDIIQNQEQEEKYIISAMNYQLNRLFKIEENTNTEIYTRLLSVGGQLYTQLLLPDKEAQRQKSQGVKQSLPSIHPGIGLIDKYSLVRSASVDTAAVDTMIRNMCTDFNTAMDKKGKLSYEDVSLLSYFTNYYLQDDSHNKDVINSLILCINKFTNIIIPVVIVEKTGFSNVYQLILRTCYCLYVYNWKAAKKDNQSIEKYITDIVGVLNSPIDNKMGQSRDLYMKVYEMNDNLIKSLPVNPDEYVYTTDDAIKIVQEICSIVSASPGFIQFKYYQVGEIILDINNRPGHIKTVVFTDYASYMESSVPINYEVVPINPLVIRENVARLNGKLIPSNGFPVLAGEENGHIQMLKQLILEELFEVESCNTTPNSTFTALHLGLPLNTESNKTIMKRISMAGNKFTYPTSSNKNFINEYNFVDTEYASILERSKISVNKYSEPWDYDKSFVSTINNMINFISKKPANADILKTSYISPFLCSQITDKVIVDLLKKFPTDNETNKYSIVVTNPDKIPTYTDRFDRNAPKPIPILKTFTIESLSAHIMKTRFDFLFPFFEIKGGDYCETKTKTACSHNYVNELKYILDSLRVGFNADLSPIVDDIHKYMAYIDKSRNIITETMVRLKHGQQVCENRVIEGKYINSSLDQIRAAIKYILNKKHENSDALFHSPDFIDICLKSYCPSGINCFNTSSTDNAPESLIDEIYNHISPTKDKAQFYKDIVISVFGVFNVSRLADNPPPVPYIDINHLKQIYYNNDSEYSEKYPLLWALHELKLQIEKLPEQNIKMLPLIENISEKEDEKDKNLPLINTLTKLIGVAIDDYKLHNEDADILSKARESISYYFMNTLKEIIEAIDIHNAASAIGTLEFLDQLAKFNSVNNLCYKNTEVDSTPYLDDSEYNNYVTNAAPIKKA
jgi:hypothetical protein